MGIKKGGAKQTKEGKTTPPSILRGTKTKRQRRT